MKTVYQGSVSVISVKIADEMPNFDPEKEESHKFSENICSG
jgi:hypothetical protein